MKRYALTDKDRAKALAIRSDGGLAKELRRQIELELLDRVLAEASMPEWYPHQ